MRTTTFSKGLLYNEERIQCVESSRVVVWGGGMLKQRGHNDPLTQEPRNTCLNVYNTQKVQYLMLMRNNFSSGQWHCQQKTNLSEASYQKSRDDVCFCVCGVFVCDRHPNSAKESFAAKKGSMCQIKQEGGGYVKATTTQWSTYVRCRNQEIHKQSVRNPQSSSKVQWLRQAQSSTVISSWTLLTIQITVVVVVNVFFFLVLGGVDQAGRPGQSLATQLNRRYVGGSFWRRHGLVGGAV